MNLTLTKEQAVWLWDLILNKVKDLEQEITWWEESQHWTQFPETRDAEIAFMRKEIEIIKSLVKEWENG